MRCLGEIIGQLVFAAYIGDTFCGLTFKIGGRFKRIHSFQHSIFVTKAHDDNASHFAMTKHVMLWYLYSLKIKYGVVTNTSSRLYFIATKGRCNFFPCTIQYFYFHSNSISTSDFIYDIFSLSRLSLVQTLTRGQETNSKLLYPVLVIEFGHAGHSVSAFIQVLFDFNSFTYLYNIYSIPGVYHIWKRKLFK